MYEILSYLNTIVAFIAYAAGNTDGAVLFTLVAILFAVRDGVERIEKRK